MFRLTAFTAVVLLGWPGSILLSQDSPVPLTGVIDFHVHAGPDSRPRSLNDIEAVRLAQQAGLRGVVLKNHFTMTADRALLAMNHVEDLEVFGGVVLNRAVGGINPEAVRQMVAFDGDRGKVVWLPTFDAEFYVTREGGTNPFVRVVENGTPVSSLIEIFSLIAEHGLVLAMGHSSPEEVILLIDAAKRQGVSRILVTHVFGQDASREQMMQMAANGAVMELDWLAVYSGTLSITDYTSAIRELGAEHFLISSDLGQAGNPAHADGLRSFIRTLKESGVTDSEIDVMARRNPALLLGLD